MTTYVLGISAFYRDSAAALLSDGEIVAAAQEERFTRLRHDAAFPAHAVAYCLQEAQISLADIDHVAFCDKPTVGFGQLLNAHVAGVDRLKSVVATMPGRLRDRLALKATLKRELGAVSRSNIYSKAGALPPLAMVDHPRAHAAAAFFSSPFQHAAVICLDAPGVWPSSSIWTGDKNSLTLKRTTEFPHSLGLLHAAFSWHAGLQPESGETQLMALAPFGKPRYVRRILDHLVELDEEGGLRLDMTYFQYVQGSVKTSRRFDELFGQPSAPGSPLTQRVLDMACSIQTLTEEMLLKLARFAQRELGEDALCLAGGIALSAAASARLRREIAPCDTWITPLRGESCAALGAALSLWHEQLQRPRVDSSALRGSDLGPWFSDASIIDYLDSVGAAYRSIDDELLCATVCEALVDSKTVGWFQGRMEFGARAHGTRIVLCNPHAAATQPLLKATRGSREALPAVAVLLRSERQDAVVPVLEPHLDVHVVHAVSHPHLSRLLQLFEQQSGSPVLVTTAFALRGEPSVCTPADAYQCFLRSEMDFLVMGSLLLHKAQQPLWEEVRDREASAGT